MSMNVLTTNIRDFAEKLAADDAPPAKKKLGPLQHAYVADAPGGTAIENTGKLLRQQDVTGRSLYDQMILAQAPLTEAVGARIRRGSSRLANNKSMRLLSLIDPTADGHQAGLVEMSTGLGKQIPEQEDATRQMYAEHIKPYQDKVTEGPTTNRETPWYMSMEGHLANLDSDIAGSSYMRNEQPGHYWFNPLSKSGPLTELGDRMSRRSVAGNALPESTGGRFRAGAIPFYSMYTGGEEAQNRLRRSAMQNNLYDQVAVPEKAPAKKDKVAYVKLSPATRAASKPKPVFQTPPHIGQPKTGPIVPPATQDATKMVMRSAPSVPNPIVPPTQSGSPMLSAQKLAGACTVPASANRYTSSAKKGKKPMPQPYARRLKRASGPMTAVAFGAGMADGIEKRSFGTMTGAGVGGLAGAGIAGLLTLLNKHRFERISADPRPDMFHNQALNETVNNTITGGLAGAGIGGLAGFMQPPKKDEDGIEKQALGSIGSTVGLLGGAASAPSGHRMEGMGRGLGQGLGWDAGSLAGILSGAGLGHVGGGMAGASLAQLVASLQGRKLDDAGVQNATNAGAQMGGGLGMLGGYFGGGMLGRSAAKGMMGDPTWEDEDAKRQATASQMAAP